MAKPIAFRSVSDQWDVLCRVFDDRYPQFVIVSQIPRLASALWYPLDLLNLLDLEAYIFSKFTLDKKCDEDGPLRMCMYTAAGAALEGCVEEGRACGWFVYLFLLAFASIATANAECSKRDART